MLMAWADYMYTGDTESLAQSYDMLKAEKTLEQRARESDGLLDTKGLRDIVDWPGGERDGYDFKPVNTVVNAFYYQCLKDMADLADALGKRDDAAEYRDKARAFQAAFNKVLFDAKRGVYVDGEGSTHASLHANMFPLAFGLVPAERRKSVADFVVSRGMKCSVYAAQYLLEGLYEAGRADAALEADDQQGRAELVQHDPRRLDDHAGGVGQPLQGQPGLEPRVGGRADQHRRAISPGRPSAGAGLRQGAHRARSRAGSPRRPPPCRPSAGPSRCPSTTARASRSS